MKLLLILIIGLFVISCNSSQPKPVKDDFGIEKFDTTKRVLPQEEIATKKKPNQPPPPTVPPPPTGVGVILLDFDGDTVRNTSWNYAGDIICAPANLTTSE